MLCFSLDDVFAGVVEEGRVEDEGVRVGPRGDGVRELHVLDVHVQDIDVMDAVLAGRVGEVHPEDSGGYT